MPHRRLAADELGAFLGAIAHPRRIQIIEELRTGAKDVGTLAGTLAVAHSNVSQHLAVLRMLRVVSERREGRRIVYQLGCARLAVWLLEGMQFIPAMTPEVEQVKSALEHARAAWGDAHDQTQSDS